MNGGFGYNTPSKIKNFDCLRTLCCWAGYFGLAQSIIWIGLTITGILSYNCVITINGTFNVATVVPTIFMALYFKGSCTPDPFPAYESEFITVGTVLSTEDILIWDCVYLGVAVCWLLASGLILIYVKKDEPKSSSGVMLSWVIVTFCICLMDLALGIIFGIDYGRFNDAAQNYNLNSVNTGPIDGQSPQILAAMVVSLSMMVLSFKGFILWFINCGLAICLLIRAIFIVTDNDGADTLFMPRKDSDDILATRPPIQDTRPINAYQEEKKPEIVSTAFINEAYVQESSPSEYTVEINQDFINRAARMSKDASFQERRFRNLDNFQQYPPLSRPESVIPEQQEVPIVVGSFPVPDYTPPMQRAAQNRNQRYQ